MIRNILKIIGIILLVLLVVFGIAVGFLIYQMEYRKTEVVSFSSETGYKLTVYMIGEPDFPFGAAHCRAVLFTPGGDEKICYSFDIHDDGTGPHESSFRVQWCSDSVFLTAKGSEQEDAVYRFYLTEGYVNLLPISVLPGVYRYEYGDNLSGAFILSLSETGTFSCYETPAGSSVATGTCQTENGYLILTESSKDTEKTFTFRIEEETLIFIKESSDSFSHAKDLPDGAVFSRAENTETETNPD